MCQPSGFWRLGETTGLGQDFRLVRYADDFVILCRDPESVRRARDAARRALGDLGLELNEEKTGLRSFDDRSRTLGYLFCRSLVLEELPPVNNLPDAKTAWLASLSLRSIRKLEPPCRRERRRAPARGKVPALV